jgi:hypothetical protein
MILNGLLHIDFKSEFVHNSNFLGHQSVCKGWLLLSDYRQIRYSAITVPPLLAKESIIELEIRVVNAAFHPP